MNHATTGLARIILDKALINHDVLGAAIDDASAAQISLARHLVRHGVLSSDVIAKTLSESLGMDLVDLDKFNIKELPLHLLDDALIARHEVLPLGQRDGQIFIATSDPTRAQVMSELGFATNAHITPVLVDENKLVRIMQSLHLGAVLELGEDDHELPDSDGEAMLDAPTVKFVHKTLSDAIIMGASDIHFEPFDKHYRVRFRIDGIMQTIANPPKASGNKISTRLKVMARLDIAERRKPQDGRIKFPLHEGKSVDFRVSTTPTLFGEKIVLRLLDSAQALIGIDTLGMNDAQKQLFLDALNRPQGMIVITGPTGSGKTISLYTALGILNRPEINIQTVEDPVEIHLDGINQVNINPKIGLDFADVLRAFLRQDPDVIMVGEIRDVQTAEIAIKAAQTGHLVLSTLHTNSAIDTIIRLKNMGVATFNITSSLSLIIAQRLVRRLCGDCKQPLDIPAQSLIEFGFSPDQIGTAKLYKPVGCHQCKDGYKGRIGIYEILPITPKLATLIMSDAPTQALSEFAKEHDMMTLRQSAMHQVISGITSLQEMERLTGA